MTREDTQRMDRGGYRSLSNAVYIRDYIKEVIVMFKEEVYDRGSLNSAMDALDRLGKEYEIRKMQRTEKRIVPSMFLKDGEGEHRIVSYWIIEEKRSLIKEELDREGQ